MKSKKLNKFIIYPIVFGIVVFLIISSLQLTSKPLDKNLMPASTSQMVIVVTESASSSQGKLFLFEKDKSLQWKILTGPIPVIVGINGLGIAEGISEIVNHGLEDKVEGDGKSPAGIFKLSKAFGYAEVDEIGELKIPYLQILEGTECIDDINSRYYNTVVQSNETQSSDWASSEKMWKADPWYRLGVIIDINTSPVKTGKGSCIFLHNWDSPNDSTVGCTAMDPVNMKKIVLWLDEGKNPMLVQLTIELYQRLKILWGLPNLK